MFHVHLNNYNIDALRGGVRPKITPIGTHGLLYSRSSMPWRLAAEFYLISVVSRTELAARGNYVNLAYLSAKL